MGQIIRKTLTTIRYGVSDRYASAKIHNGNIPLKYYKSVENSRKYTVSDIYTPDFLIYYKIRFSSISGYAVLTSEN